MPEPTQNAENGEVSAGQVWADNDWRSEGRTLQVIRTDDTHALCEVLTDAPHTVMSKVGKTTRIALKRFKPTSTGYVRLPPESGSGMPEFVIESEQFARVLNNALAFCPAINYTTKRILIGCDAGHGVYAIGTDGYCAGMDTAPADTGDTFRVEMHREAVIELERQCRMDKKGNGRAVLGPLVLSYYGQSGAFVDYPHMPVESADLWDVITESLIPQKQFRVAFTPTYLARFSKVRADKDSRIMDVAIDDPDSPVLLKIGPTFRGLIAPVKREKHAKLVGADSLW